MSRLGLEARFVGDLGGDLAGEGDFTELAIVAIAEILLASLGRPVLPLGSRAQFAGWGGNKGVLCPVSAVG